MRIRVQPDWGFKGRVNEDGHLVYVLKGHGGYRVGDEEVELASGVFIFVGPGVLHEAWPDPADPPEIIPLRFSIETRAGNKDPLKGFSFHGRAGPDSSLEGLFEELHQQASVTRGGFRRALCDSLVHCILSLGHLESRKMDGASLLTRLEKVRKRLAVEVPGPSVKDMARQCHLSERHFCRAFSEAYGLPPREFRLSVMTDRAMVMLMDGKRSVGGIALDLGYRDAFSFSRQFKLRTGSSPLKWRKENR